MAPGYTVHLPWDLRVAVDAARDKRDLSLRAAIVEALILWLVAQGEAEEAK
tara:strand:- start:4107 stop:4259 length:153 start_codon:yes stop_codon:yes gene_type:complete